MSVPVIQSIDFYNYILTSPLGFIGHICSFITFSSKTLRLSSTGLLFLLLTVSDTLYQLMLIYNFIVQTFQMSTSHNMHLCRFCTFILNFATVTSAWLLVLISLDRWIRVRFPHRQARVCTRKMTVYSVTLVCICTTLLTCHLLVPDYAYFNGSNTVCGLTRSSVVAYTNFYFNIWPILQSIIFYFLPSCLMITGVIGIYFKLRMQRTMIVTSMKREKLQRQMLILMIASVGCFAVCTLPYSIYRIINLRSESTSTASMETSILTIFFNMNYSYNFYLRCMTSQLFRRTFMQQMKRFYMWCKRQQGQHQNKIVPLQTIVMRPCTLPAFDID